MNEKDKKPVGKSSSAKDVFLHLLMMVTLYASAISFLVVVFQLVNIWIPDIVDGGDGFYRLESSQRALRGGLSFLIVMFPSYVFTGWYLQKEYQKNAEKLRLRIRLWLIYFTLFVAALVILFALVMIFNTFLNGEITWRFVLKFLSVLFVAGSVFGYYLHDIKRHKLN
jgi:hypothetical protein